MEHNDFLRGGINQKFLYIYVQLSAPKMPRLPKLGIPNIKRNGPGVQIRFVMLEI